VKLNTTRSRRYATKYLIKAPSEGFPDWVLDMGDETRIRRYSASKGFWGTTAKATTSTSTERKNTFKTYRQRIATCGDSVHVFEVKEGLDRQTGEIRSEHVWLGQLDADAAVIDQIPDSGNPERRRRSLGGNPEPLVQSTTLFLTFSAPN
jgi:hypothetical protein